MTGKITLTITSSSTPSTPTPVTPEGGSEHWYPSGMGGGWQHEEGDPYAIDSTGAYEIPVKIEGTGWNAVIYADVLEFTAPEEGEHSYIFSWDTTDDFAISYLNAYVYDIDVDDDCLINDDENGTLVFSLTKGQKVTIVLLYQDYTWEADENSDIRYVFTVESGDPISEGSIYLPYEIDDFEGTHTAPEGVTEAYFALPFNWDEDSFEVTFGSGIQLSVLQYGRNSDPVAKASGDTFTPAQYNKSYLYVTAPAGTQISFTLTKVVTPGSASLPIELTKDQEESYEFTGWNNAWFTFTPAQSGYYRVTATYENENGAGVNGVNVYAALDGGYGSGQIADTLYASGRCDVYLESGNTYYLELVNNWGNTITIKVTDTPSEEGGIASPKALSDGRNEVEDKTQKYYTYTATTDGYVVFSSNAEYGANLTVYSDAHYSVSAEADYGRFVTYYVESGDTLYVFVDADEASVDKLVLDVVYLTDYTITVEDENNLEGLKLEVYAFDPNQPLSRGDLLLEVDVDAGLATFNLPLDTYVLVLTGYDTEVYISEQVIIIGSEGTTATLTVEVAPEPVDCTVTIDGFDKLSGKEVHLTITNTKTEQVAQIIKVDSATVTVSLLPGTYSVTIEDLPEGFFAYWDDLNTEGKTSVTIYIVEQPTLEVDADDWVTAEVLPYKSLEFKLGSSVQLGTPYWIMLDPDSTDGEREYVIDYGDNGYVTLTPRGNYLAGLTFSNLRLSITNYDTAKLVLKFKLVSKEPAVYIELDKKVSAQISDTNVAKFTVADSVTAGNYNLVAEGFDMMFSGTVTIYIGDSDNTGVKFTRQNWAVSPGSYKVHLEPGMVIRAKVDDENKQTGITLSISPAVEGTELHITQNEQEITLNLSESKAGDTLKYIIHIDIANIDYSNGGYVMIKMPDRGAPLPTGVKATLDCGGGVTQTANGSDMGQINLGFNSLSNDSISWELTLELGDDFNPANSTMAITFIYFG